MNKQQRNRSLNLALRMHEMEIQLAILLRFNLRDELRNGVQVRLGFAPVERVLSMLGEWLVLSRAAPWDQPASSGSSGKRERESFCLSNWMSASGTEMVKGWMDAMIDRRSWGMC